MVNRLHSGNYKTIVGNGLAPFRLFVADDYCRERPCAVPLGHVAEGVKPLPYENDKAKVDILAPFRLTMLRKGTSPFPTKTVKPRWIPLRCSAWLWQIIVGNGLAPFRLVVAGDYCRGRPCAVPFGCGGWLL